MKRAFILLLDSFGIGAAADAAEFNDQAADTLGHILEAHPNLNIPNLTRLGLLAAHQLVQEQSLSGVRAVEGFAASYGYAQELSHGKDTPSGHWEIAGVPVLFDWGYFPKGFPDELINEFVRRAKLLGILGNHHASGTVIINQLGDEHVKTAKPIIYTSGDSVFQIAAHEEHFGLSRLYEICQIARELVDQYQVGRVIARPFLGADADYYRTANRKDYATPPPADTLLDKLIAAGGEVIAIGKVADIFAHRGISQEIKADGNLALFDETLNVMHTAGDKSLIFTNFVDFDSKYGHRRDVAGYAKALEVLDARLPEFEALLQPGDVAIITADHGCDPSLPGSDHTREYIPLLVFGPDIKPQSLGKRESFADIGQSLAKYFDLTPFNHGKSFLD